MPNFIPTFYGIPRAGASNKGRKGKFSHFLALSINYENDSRYAQSYYLRLIGSCICAFDWHQDRWPWMTWTV